jgi:beta-lactamase superfamily II metal-dependent hydrolase
MVQRVILDGLWCGQGMANMVRIYADSNVDPATTAPDGLCVFDFGSGGLSQSKKVLGITPPVAFMMKQLQMQKDAGKQPHIDLMLISHQDRDHWQLLNELDKQIVSKGMTVTVGTMLLAGLNWRKSSKNIVKKFVQRSTSYYWYNGQYSSYNDPSSLGDPVRVGDMEMRMLITNVATNDSAEDIERNCSSAVAIVQLGQLSFILPGDATWETFVALKSVMDRWPNNPLPFVYSASVPHHGALRTMNMNSSTDKPDLSALVWFTDYTRPTSIYASAGIKNTHSHPYRVVMDTMGRYTRAQQFEKRPIVVFNGPTGNWEQIPDITNNIYTTVLNLVSPARTANWIFNITPTMHATEVQLFEAGVPAILSPPVLNEMELAAQRYTAEMEDTDMNWSEYSSELDFALSPLLSGPVIPYRGGPPVAAQDIPQVLPITPAAPRLKVHHMLPTAGLQAAHPVRRRPPPPRRVHVVAAT